MHYRFHSKNILEDDEMVKILSLFFFNVKSLLTRIRSLYLYDLLMLSNSRHSSYSFYR